MDLFDENNKENLPILKVYLTFDDRRMQFYPPYQELEELVLAVVQLVIKTMQQVPTVNSWLMGGSTPQYVEVNVAEHILQNAYSKLKDAAKRNFEAPQVYLQKTFGKTISSRVNT